MYGSNYHISDIVLVEWLLISQKKELYEIFCSVNLMLFLVVPFKQDELLHKKMYLLEEKLENLEVCNPEKLLRWDVLHFITFSI